MIDLHSHILPAMDDGPTTLEESLVMARSAAREGIEIVYATPHHLRAPFHNGKEKVIEAVTQLNEAIRKENIPLEVRAGQEVRVCQEIVQQAYEGQLLPLEGTSYLLIELPSSSIPDFLEDLLHEIVVLGWTPILAHPERNLAIAREPELLRSLVHEGVLCQLTSHSLTGVFGSRTESTALELCRRRLVHFIASDAHDAVQRPFQLKKAFAKVEKLLGKEWTRYFDRNARGVAAGKRIESWNPEKKPSLSSKLLKWRINSEC